MRAKSSKPEASAERVVKDIRRATRRHFSAEGEIRIVLDDLRGDDSIDELYRKEGTGLHNRKHVSVRFWNRSARAAVASLTPDGELKMYIWAITLAIIALIAAVLGFGGVADALANVALIVFILALVSSIILFVMGWRAAKAADKRL